MPPRTPEAKPEAHWAALALIAAGTLLTAALGGYASVSAQSFYQSLNQPAWAPPASVFGPVWTLLYLMMATAAWLVVRRRGSTAARPAMAWFAAQLVFNAAWTWLFFRWHLGAAAFVEVLMLLALVAITLRTFWRVRALAGWLLLPYLVWVTFASALTFAVWQLNPGVL